MINRPDLNGKGITPEKRTMAKALSILGRPGDAPIDPVLFAQARDIATKLGAHELAKKFDDAIPQPERPNEIDRPPVMTLENNATVAAIIASNGGGTGVAG